MLAGSRKCQTIFAGNSRRKNTDSVHGRFTTLEERRKINERLR